MSDAQTDKLFVPDADTEVETLSRILSVLPSVREPERTARALISEFCTAEAVLRAPCGELAAVVNKSAALFLSMQLDLYRLAEISSADVVGLTLTRDNIGGYVTALFKGAATELVYLICLDGKNRVLSRSLIDCGRLSDANVRIGEIARLAAISGAKRVVLAHNHPSAQCLPSAADIACTNVLRIMLAKIGIELTDHLIAAGNVYCGIMGVLAPCADD